MIAISSLKLAAAGVASSAVLLVACSSRAATPSVAQLAGSASAAASPNAALHLAGQCLRQHGLPGVPDPVVATDGPAAGQGILNKPALKAYADDVAQQAITACRAALDKANIAIGSSSTDLSQQELEGRLALAQCIRAHGVPNFSDPNPTTGEVTPPPGLTKNSPSLLAAIRACPAQAQSAGLSPGES